MAQYDDVNAGAISVIGFISIVITFVIIVASQVLYFQYQEIETARKYAAAPTSPADVELTSQSEALNSYTWIDRDKGIVSQPIEDSIQNVLSKLNSSPESTDK